MKNILSKIQKKSVLNNSKCIVHLGVIALVGAALVGAAVIIYVNSDGSSTRERLGSDNNNEVVEESEVDEEAEAESEEDKDGGAYHVLFNDDSIKGTMGDSQPMTTEIELKDAWAQTCDGLYSRWEGTVYQNTTLTTDAGKDERGGIGEFNFVINKGDGKLSADKSTITIKHRVNCYYCEDPWIELVGAVVGGAKEACK